MPKPKATKPTLNKRTFAKTVLAALRSGKYKQTTEQLKGSPLDSSKGAGYCCLGVVADCLVKLKVGYRWEYDSLVRPRFGGEPYNEEREFYPNTIEMGGQLDKPTLEIIGMTEKMQEVGISMNDLTTDVIDDEDDCLYEPTPVPFELIADMWEGMWKDLGVL
jgi:hypothetical protein